MIDKCVYTERINDESVIICSYAFTFGTNYDIVVNQKLSLPLNLI